MWLVKKLGLEGFRYEADFGCVESWYDTATFVVRLRARA